VCDHKLCTSERTLWKLKPLKVSQAGANLPQGRNELKRGKNHEGQATSKEEVGFGKPSLATSATREEKPLKDVNPTSATGLKYVREASERRKRREVEKT